MTRDVSRNVRFEYGRHRFSAMPACRASGRIDCETIMSPTREVCMASKCTVLAFAILMLGAERVADADENGFNATITVIEDGESPDDILEVIDLPHHAGNWQPGNASDTAPLKDDRHDFGRPLSQDARDGARTDLRTDAPARNGRVPN
jgi:hypothetical protein